MTSSEESEEEHLDNLKAALDLKFNDGTLRCRVEKNAVDPISLRRNVDEEDESFNHFKVSTEFQSYVSKQLEQLLDSELEKLLVADLTPIRSKSKPSGGVKLLNVSEKYLKIKSAKAIKLEEEQETFLRKKQRCLQLEPDSDLEEKCHSVAVNYQDIVDQKDMTFWSKRTKAKVAKYKRDSKGNLVLQEDTFIPISYNK